MIKWRWNNNNEDENNRDEDENNYNQDVTNRFIVDIPREKRRVADEDDADEEDEDGDDGKDDDDEEDEDDDDDGDENGHKPVHRWCTKREEKGGSTFEHCTTSARFHPP